MKTFLATILAATIFGVAGSSVVFASETDMQHEEVRMRATLYSADYDSMMSLVQKQKFAEAFPEIMRFARYGEKYAQYLAGLLMVSGEEVPPNVEEGLVWMRLSLEQKTSDWEKRYEGMIANLTPEQLSSLNPLYEEFKQKYGVDSQFMNCSYERLRSSNLRQHTCRKNLLMSEFYMVVQYNETK
jgi:TPR repeat protein